MFVVYKSRIVPFPSDAPVAHNLYWAGVLFLTCHCSLILVRRGGVSSPQHNRHFLLFYCSQCLHMHPGDVLILGNLSVSWRYSALRTRDGGCSIRGYVSL